MNKTILTKLEWLIGQWEGLQGTGVYHEEWEIINGNEFTGKAYLIKKGEIINQESLRIHSEDVNTYYTADVSHNPGPVSFKMTVLDDHRVVFENLMHDFPQKITYEKKEDNTLLAFVEATTNGKTRKIEYKLKKLN